MDRDEVQAKRPGGIRIGKALKDGERFFLAGAVAGRFDGQRVARQLDKAIIFLVEHAVDQFGKIALGGDAVLDKVRLELVRFLVLTSIALSLFLCRGAVAA